LPTPEEVIFVKQNFSVKGILSAEDKLHLEAKKYLDENDVLPHGKCF
jgi:hypothetical protein